MNDNIKIPPITDDFRELVHYNPNTDDIVDAVQELMREAYAAGLEDAAKEFDRRIVLDRLGFAIGFYDPEEPSQIIRSLKPKGVEND